MLDILCFQDWKCIEYKEIKFCTVQSKKREVDVSLEDADSTEDSLFFKRKEGDKRDKNQPGDYIKLKSGG